MMVQRMPKHVGNNAVNRRRKVCYSPTACRQHAVRQRTVSTVHVPCCRKVLRHSVLPHALRCLCHISAPSTDSRPCRTKAFAKWQKTSLEPLKLTFVKLMHLQSAFWCSRFAKLPCGQQLHICTRLCMKRENYAKSMAASKLLKLASCHFCLLQLLAVFTEITAAMTVGTKYEHNTVHTCKLEAKPERCA